MKRKHWNIFWIIVAGVIVSGMVASVVQSRATFKELVHDAIGDPENTYSIVMHKYIFFKEPEAGIEITDRDQINRFFELLADVKLRVTDGRVADESYWFMLNPHRGPSMSVIFDENTVSVMNSSSHHKKYSQTYEIVNDFDYNELKALFENSQ